MVSSRCLLPVTLVFLDFFHILCTFQEYIPPITSHQKKYFVYDWPENLVNLWPTLEESTSDMKVTSHLHYGTGSLLNESIGMFDSFQFGLCLLLPSISRPFIPLGLFKLFHRRAMIDYRRTMNPEEASIFFIPYDSAMDAIVTRVSVFFPSQSHLLIARNSPEPRLPSSQKGSSSFVSLWYYGSLPRKVLELLTESPYFRRNYGHDHFIIHSGNQCLGHMNNKPSCRQFLGFACENCTKLSIETMPQVWHQLILSDSPS